MNRIQDEYTTLESWLFESALPLWSSTGVDPSGGFFEKLNEDGAPTNDPRRARVVGRQIYAFATAERLGWTGPARAILRHGLSELETRFLLADGTVISVIDADGTVRDSRFDLYDYAFVLFGLAAAHSVGERPGDLERLAKTIRAKLTAGWRHPVAGFEEAVPRSLPLKANPHMHIFEASLAWLETAPDEGWSALADEIAELCLLKFLAPDTGALREFFDGDWTMLTDHAGSVVEPGHQSEWAWLLIRWGRLRGRDDAIAAARRLIEIAEIHGVDPARDLAINELNADLSPRDALARLWPQTERLKSYVALAGIETEPAADHAREKIVAASEGLRRFFAHPIEGAWWEHLGEGFAPVPEPSRTSSLYHIVCAVMTFAAMPDVGKEVDIHSS